MITLDFCTLHNFHSTSKVFNFLILTTSFISSDEGSLDSPSDQPPMSPQIQSPDAPEEAAIALPNQNQNGESDATSSADVNIKLRRYLHFFIVLAYIIYTKPLIELD